MYKYLLIFLILIPSTYALSIELDYTILGQEQNFLGYIIIPPGTYDPDSKIKLSTEDSSDSKKLKDIINCDEIDCTGVLDYYISDIEAPTESYIDGPNIQTGIRIPKGIKSISNAEFDIENKDSDYPNTPIIDIGADNNPEWIYPGYATDNFPQYFSGPEIPDVLEYVEISSTGNCQKLLLQKSMKYKIRAYMKKIATLSLFIPGTTAETGCIDPLTQDWEWVECTINLTKPLQTDYYNICLISQPGNFLYINSSAQNPQGYDNCLTSCKSVDRDYIIQSKGAEYISELRTKENYNQSNTKLEYFSKTLGDYYVGCTFYNDYCTIPINVTSKNNKNIKLSNLKYEIVQDSTKITKTQFLSAPPTKVEGEGLIISSEPIIIPLSEFDVETPDDLNEYNLKVEFNSETDQINYVVAELPIARFNSSKEKALVFEQISFDASQSTSPEDNELEFEWDFGDNKTSSYMLTNHYYLTPGIFTVTLIVIDTETGISSMPFEKTIEITSSETEISDLIDTTLPKIERAISYMNSAQANIRQIYTDLDFDQQLIQKKSTLTNYKDKISTLTQSQNIQEEINEILATLPLSISIKNTLEIIPYTSYNDIDKLYPTKSLEFKETLHDLNSRITKRTEVSSLQVTYLSNNIENYILIKKTITPENSLKDLSIIERIPTTLVTPENIYFFNLEPQITTSGNYIEAEIPLNIIQSSEPTTIAYKLPSQDMNLIKDTKTIIVPKSLGERGIPFECGNGICNPAEDYRSCPEDCPKEKTPWLLVFLFLLFIAVIAGLVYYSKKHPSFAKKLKIENIINKIKLDKFFKRNPFESETEFKTVIGFVRRSKKKGYPIMKIREALERKGWSQDKINYAIKKAK